MVDLHVHCDYSIDAEGAVDEYVKKALDAGLTHICFTTHCDLDPQRRHHDGRVRLEGEIVDVTVDWLESYIEDVRRASHIYSDRGLKVLCGLEMGYVPGIEQMIEAVIASHPFDYVLGGVHTLAGIDIVSSRESGEYFKARTPRQVCEEYFRYLEHTVCTDFFDCIAHIDIYKRCGLDFYGDPLNEAHSGLIEPVLEEIAKRGICLELNSGGLRKGLPSPYPSPDILEAARSAGVQDITVGSDCHCPEDIGGCVAQCLEIAITAGFETIVFFEDRIRKAIPIEEIYSEGRTTSK